MDYLYEQILPRRKSFLASRIIFGGSIWKGIKKEMRHVFLHILKIQIRSSNKTENEILHMLAQFFKNEHKKIEASHLWVRLDWLLLKHVD